MEIKNEYRRVRRNLLARIKRLEKKGYDVEVKVPKIPKKITEASIRRLNKMDSGWLKKHSFAPDVETGEKINYYQKSYRNKQKKQKPDKKHKNIPHDYELALDRFYEIIDMYPERSYMFIKARLDSLVAVYGQKVVGLKLKNMIENGDIVTPSEAYNFGVLIEMSNSLAKLLELTKDEEKELYNDLERFAYIEEFM